MRLGLTGEDLIQADLIQWARKEEKKCPPLAFIYHCPSGGSRHPVEAMRLKALGVVRGIPDLFLAYPAGIYAGLFIEIKNGDKGRLSPEQKLWIEALRKNRYRAEVVTSTEQGKKLLKEYLSYEG